MQFWAKAATDLGIEIIAPFEVEFPDGSKLRVAALVKNFGKRNGMLVDSDYEVLKPHIARIVENGYGYSSGVGGAEEYDAHLIIEILRDWGWSGAESDKPSWID
jgi:hypothetical protein